MNKKIMMILFVAFSFTVYANNALEEYDSNELQLNTTVNASAFQKPSGAGGSVLYDNGSLVNSVGTGVGGLDESILQNVSFGMTSLGAAHSSASGFRVADDFTIAGADWTIESIVFYAYQSFETASTITAVNLQIWDGVPGAAGSNIVFGDDVTNRMTSTTNSNILRVTEDSTGANTDRQIAASTVEVNITLPAGTYWLDWATDGSGGSGPWAPPITITGQTTTGNALQANAGVWGDLLDGGSSTQQGLPFTIQGTNIVLAPPTPVPFTSNLVLIFLTFSLLALTFRVFRTKK